MTEKTTFVKIGDVFFKHRNKVFPLILIVLFVSFKPAHVYMGSHALEVGKDWLAIGITLSGLVLRAMVIGFAYIKRGGLNKRVYAENLVTEGFFGLCRNPLYVGNMLIYTGIFLMHGSPYVFVIGVLAYYIIYESIIAAEEHFLRENFGEAYQNYCRDVSRWGIKFSKFGEATEGMRFNFKRVLIKDYPTIANALLALLALELLESWHFHSVSRFRHEWGIYGVCLFVLVVVVVSISVAKKRKLLKV